MGGGPGSLTGYGPYGHKESDKTEATKHARMQTASDVMIGAGGEGHVHYWHLMDGAQGC